MPVATPSPDPGDANNRDVQSFRRSTRLPDGRRITCRVELAADGTLKEVVTVEEGDGRAAFEIGSVVNAETDASQTSIQDRWDTGSVRVTTTVNDNPRGSGVSVAARGPDGKMECAVDVGIDVAGGVLKVTVTEISPDGDEHHFEPVEVKITPVEVDPPGGVDLSKLLPGDLIPTRRGPKQPAQR